MPYTWPPTLDEVKAALNKTTTADDTELQGVIDAAVAALENHPGYRITDAVTTNTYTEWYDGGSDTIVLRHYPVTAITSVTEYLPTSQALAAEPLDTTSTFTGYGYSIDLATGIVSRTSGGSSYTFQGQVQVVYTAGSPTVPADIREAALKLVDHMWSDQRGASAQPFNTSGDEYQPPVTGHLLPWEVEELLAPYRRTPAIA